MSHTTYFYADLEKPYVTTVSVRLQLLLLRDNPENKTSDAIQKLQINRHNFSSYTDLTSDLSRHYETMYKVRYHTYR
jgi:ACT domain-containing protein